MFAATGASSYATIPLLRQGVFAGALLIYGAPPASCLTGSRSATTSALQQLGVVVSRALFDDRQQAALVDTACRMLMAAAQPGTALTTLLQTLSTQTSALVEQSHAIDLAAASALVPQAHSQHSSSSVALLLRPGAAPGPAAPGGAIGMRHSAALVRSASVQQEDGLALPACANAGTLSLIHI